MASSAKFLVFAALLLVLNVHWATCQFYPGSGGYDYPVYYSGGGCKNNNDLDTLLPILILALSGRGGLGGNNNCGCGNCNNGGCNGGNYCSCGRC